MTNTGTSPEASTRWLTEQRWFDRSETGKTGAADASAGTTDVRLHGPVPLPGSADAALQVAETGDGHRYQLLVSTAPPSRTETIPGTAVDRATDPVVATALVDLAVNSTTSSTVLGTLAGHWVRGEAPPGSAPARPLGAEQSNTSVVVGGTHVLKIFRRLAVGENPEIEIGLHLHQVAHGHDQDRSLDDAPLPVASLTGWYELVDPDGSTTTLGVVNRLVPGALDGWALALSALAADPPELLPRLRALGVAVARLHGALARPSTGTDPERDRFGSAPLGSASVHDIAHATKAQLVGLSPAISAATIARLSERIDGLSADLDLDDLGAAIRTHGDLHLGQTVVGADGWVIFDFEGEPSRSLEDRRRHHSPLRDVAGLLRSLSYAVETVRRSGVGAVSEGWEPAARAAILDGYLATIDTALLPRSMTSVRRLLSLFGLERAGYEVRYEIAHRPDWVHLPLAALDRY